VHLTFINSRRHQPLTKPTGTISMKGQNKMEAYVTRNARWLRFLLPAIILIVMPELLSTTFGSDEMQFPRWMLIWSQVIGFVGVIFAGIFSRLTNTLSARIFQIVILFLVIVLLVGKVVVSLS
jgi:hypothetical protein